MPKVSNRKIAKSTSYVTPLKSDSVNFKGSLAKVSVPLSKAEEIAKSLTSSTSGHRAINKSENFTSEIVKLIIMGVGVYSAQEAKNQGKVPTVVIGGDTRKATRDSLPLIRDTLVSQGINVIYIKDPVPTPLLAIAAKKFDTDISGLLTASHNPWEYGGYNLVTKAGAIAPAYVTKEVGDNMVRIAEKGYVYTDKNSSGTVTEFDPFKIYSAELDKLNLINWDNIKKSDIDIHYDGLQGAGPYTMSKLLQSHGIKFNNIKSYGQEGPNPIDVNLNDLKKSVSESDKALRIGLANDGDADRFGVVDENGKFINANDVILLTAYHLANNKGLTGSIIRSQATSMQLDALANKYGLDSIETPVGFKYIAEDIQDLRKEGKDILVAGEESGGLTVNGHIPEKDGIIALSLMMDLVATEKKPISKILRNVKESLGVAFSINNFSQKVTDNDAKKATMQNVEQFYNKVISGEGAFGENHAVDIQKTLDTRKNMEKYRPGGDGYKFIMTDGSSVLIRESGTEPLIKCYIEATGENQGIADANSNDIRKDVEKLFFGK